MEMSTGSSFTSQTSISDSVSPQQISYQRATSEQSEMSRFFLLRKDSERRQILVSIMTEFANEVDLHFLVRHFGRAQWVLFQIADSWMSLVRKDIQHTILTKVMLVEL